MNAVVLIFTSEIFGSFSRPDTQQWSCIYIVNHCAQNWQLHPRIAGSISSNVNWICWCEFYLSIYWSVNPGHAFEEAVSSIDQLCKCCPPHLLFTSCSVQGQSNTSITLDSMQVQTSTLFTWGSLQTHVGDTWHLKWAIKVWQFFIKFLLMFMYTHLYV